MRDLLNYCTVPLEIMNNPPPPHPHARLCTCFCTLQKQLVAGSTPAPHYCWSDYQGSGVTPCCPSSSRQPDSLRHPHPPPPHGCQNPPHTRTHKSKMCVCKSAPCRVTHLFCEILPTPSQTKTNVNKYKNRPKNTL